MPETSVFAWNKKRKICLKIKCCDFKNLYSDIGRVKTSVVLFGAGAIGQVSIPSVLKEYNLLDKIDCYLDNDESKWGTKLNVLGKSFDVRSPKVLENYPSNTIILLNISRYSDAVNQLEQMPCTKDMDCYIMPMMLIHNFCMEKSKGVPTVANEMLIPNRLHYMWLGRKPIPDNLKRCIDSWRKFCPDYEIIEWNEDNYDIEKHPYMKAAYEAKAYGFVPDYARLDIIYNEGGFYLDTDVEIKKNLDGLRYQEAFCGVEKWQIINFGGLSGAVKGYPMIKEFLDARQQIGFYNSDGSLNKNTCGFYDTRVALNHGYKINGETQCINGMNIYAYDYFHSFDYMSGITNATENTYSIHWFNGGWLDESMKKQNEDSKRMYLNMYHRALINA